MVAHFLLAQAANTSQSIFGVVSPPPGVADFNAQVSGGSGDPIGLIIFLSNAIKLATIVAGLWVFYNFITAGFIYITESSNQSSAATKVKDQITSSVLGLLLIVFSYTLIALISLFFFHDATYILNPQIQGPNGAASTNLSTSLGNALNNAGNAIGNAANNSGGNPAGNGGTGGGPTQ